MGDTRLGTYQFPYQCTQKVHPFDSCLPNRVKVSSVSVLGPRRLRCWTWERGRTEIGTPLQFLQVIPYFYFFWDRKREEVDDIVLVNDFGGTTAPLFLNCCRSVRLLFRRPSTLFVVQYPPGEKFPSLNSGL